MHREFDYLRSPPLDGYILQNKQTKKLHENIDTVNVASHLAMGAIARAEVDAYISDKLQ